MHNAHIFQERGPCTHLQNYQIMFDYLDKESQENLYYYLHISIHI